jgi:hypothetical protein
MNKPVAAVNVGLFICLYNYHSGYMCSELGAFVYILEGCTEGVNAAQAVSLNKIDTIFVMNNS